MGKEFSIIEEKVSGSNAYILLRGHVNVISAAAIQHKLEKMLQDGQIYIVLNMCQVEFLSSAGIRVLLSIYKKAKACGGKLAVEKPSENVINVLGLAALDEMLVK